ncbi:MAG: hypothetical protein F4Y49_13840 [Dehalococcoidia bacterium]|nr:hypothetical protein [Dehalococcoidia bacterium]MYA62762.1 hypothetical protein [Dehalococcoidia bacterium]
MHDGIHAEKAGTPSVTICTDIFEITARSMAEMWGAPTYPIVLTEHPIAELTREQLRARAEDMLPEMETILLGART